MQDFPDLIKEYIFRFLNNEVCCKNPKELSILATNKSLYHFYTTHFKYQYHPFMHTNFQNKKILKTSIDRIPGKLCCNCSKLNRIEQNKLNWILQRYFQLYNISYDNPLYHHYIKQNYKKKKYKEELSMLNVHFDTEQELTNFIIKMDKISSNLWFNESRCCNGNGCDIEIII